VVVTSPFTAAVQEVRDSVVGINNYQTVRYSNYGGYGFGFGYGYGNGYGNNRGNSGITEKESLSATGSGVVVGEGGYVLTNYHVVEDASRLTVTDGDNEYDANLIAYDENLDIAVLKASGLNLKPVRLGDSDSLQVGDWAICIGNPLSSSFSKTVTAGIVSAMDRSIESTSYDKYGRRETTSNTMIQVDAAINSGNSGGGMFSVTGELMGIPTLKYSGSAYSGATIEGIGMCIPINVAKPLIEDVLNGVIVGTDETTGATKTESSAANNGLTGKPRMGITITAMNSASSAVQNGILPNGVYVTDVEEGGPAATAGMQAGDIIVDVNDTIITSTSQLQAIIGELKAGDTLAVKVYRVPGITELTDSNDIPDGEYVDLSVTLAIVDNIKQ